MASIRISSDPQWRYGPRHTAFLGNKSSAYEKRDISADGGHGAELFGRFARVRTIERTFGMEL